MGIFDWFLPYSIQKDRSYGTHARHRLDVYTPKSGVTNATKVVVFFHGGGFQQGNKADYQFVADMLARQGHIVVIPNYRLWNRNNPTVNRWPAQIEDGVRVVAWCRANLKYASLSRPVVLMGHSAGGIIAKHLNLDEFWLPSPALGAIGLAGASDLDALNRPDLLPWEFFPPGYEDSKNAYFHVTGSEPAMLLQHGMDDTIEPPIQTQMLEMAIGQAGGAVEAKYYAGVDHTELIAALSRSGSHPEIRDDLLDWLAAH